MARSKSPGDALGSPHDPSTGHRAACRIRAEDFARVLGAAVLLIALGTMTFRFSTDWSVADSFYVAVATLTTSSIMNPKLTIDDPWLEIFTAAYVLIGIGILVEVARRLGMGFIAAREEMRTADGDTAKPAGGARPA